MEPVPARFPPEELRRVQEAIRRESLDGWLFYNFQHRDKLSDSILRLPGGASNSRPWFYAVPARGDPLGIIHAVEPDALNTLPGSKTVYAGREDLMPVLGSLGGKRWGVHVSEAIPAISYLDAGAAAVLEKADLTLVSAAALIQRFRGVLDEAGIDSHERAVGHLHEIVETAWGAVKSAYAGRKKLYEGMIRDLMLEEMARRNLETSHPPIVAAGVNTGNPHYDFPAAPDPGAPSGALIREGDVIQFDLWAREKTAGAVYGDISWVGVFAPRAAEKAEKAFADLLSAREGAYQFIEAELAEGRRPEGAAVDRRAREILITLGYERALKHRTGHGIDTEVHGSGVNIDGVEFPDFRLLLDGSCFSLEPGIYFSDFGLRTEIDVYIRAGKPVISGKDHRRQSNFLVC